MAYCDGNDSAKSRRTIVTKLVSKFKEDNDDEGNNENNDAQFTNITKYTQTPTFMDEALLFARMKV
eukprot:9014120-Ditylum_brightwellii.AAC.1